AMITAYAQGLHLLKEASKTYKYELNIAEIAQIWRGGCIIRALLLEDIYQAYKKNADLEHLYTDENIGRQLKDTLSDLQDVVITATKNGIAIPAYSSVLTYFNSMRTARMPSNLIQAQ